ncbi:MAG: hypothetical protein ACE5OR_00985, partial [bacterium]
RGKPGSDGIPVGRFIRKEQRSKGVERRAKGAEGQGLEVGKVVNPMLSETQLKRLAKEVTGQASLTEALKETLSIYVEQDYMSWEEAVTNIEYFEGIASQHRLFGANNMRIGWHIHPYGQEVKHVKSEPVTIEEFLQLLEKELKGKDKLI